MEGLEIGLGDQETSVINTVKSLARNMTDSFNPQLQATAQLGYTNTSAMPQMNTGGYTVYNVKIDGAKINEDKEIREQFAKMMKMMARKGLM